LLSLSACSGGDKSLGGELTATTAPPAGALGVATGTAFFVSFDDTLLTARHLVDKCLRIDIWSETVRPTAVWVVASYDALDLAVLRIEGAFSVPSALKMTRKSSPDASVPLKAYGYPLDVDPRRASAAEARIANALAPEFFSDSFAPVLGDPRYFLWLDASLRHGYSGGPVLDKDGTVVGVVRSIVRKDPRYNIAMGPGAVSPEHQFRAADHRSGSAADGDDRAARSAIVRFVCWRDSSAAADE
jgi:S1-C subfamily serine protease